MNYLQSDTPKVTPGSCVFCTKAALHDEDGLKAELIVGHSQYVFVTLNLYPYNNGHLMVVPHQHVPSMEALSTEALTDLMVTANRAMTALRKLYNPAAFNVGANIGPAAGAGIAAHFHLHIVPRWGGDANFMSVIAGTRVIPDTLEDTWRKLRELW
jgi:ATP adenylyltransferase